MNGVITGVYSVVNVKPKQTFPFIMQCALFSALSCCHHVGAAHQVQKHVLSVNNRLLHHPILPSVSDYIH
jgi:hypothetical protein